MGKETPKKKITEMTVKDLYNSLLQQGLNARQSKDGKKLSPLEIATIIKKTVPVANISGRIGIYYPKKGIYELERSYIHRIIHQVEPNTTKSGSDEVIFKLSVISKETKEIEDKSLVPVANGVYNRKERRLESFNPKYIFTSTIATNYNENAKNPFIKTINGDNWDVESWVRELTADKYGNPDEEKEVTLWQVMSACICGDSYRKAVFFIGDGNDGKGTVQLLITNIIGKENVGYLKIDQFSDKFLLATVEGKRCVIGDDVQAGLYLDDSSNFNSFVTGEPVKLEIKSVQAYFKPFNVTVIQSSNEMPKFRNKTNGTARRILILLFHGSFKQSKGDNWKIKDEYIKKQDVREYVLKKALEMDFKEFHTPKESIEELEEFKLANDTVLAFLMEVDLGNLKSTIIPTAILYNCYKAWCKVGGYTAVTMRVFSMSAKKHLLCDWELKNARVATNFNPYDFIEYYRFNWGEEEQKKQYKCFVKF